MALKPLLVEIESRTGEAASSVNIGDIEGAMTSFHDALALDPALDLDPEAEAQHLATAMFLIQEGVDLVKQIRQNLYDLRRQSREQYLQLMGIDVQ